METLTRWLWLLLAGGLLGAVGCDPLAPGDWLGEPLATFQGGVTEERPGLIHRDDLRAAVFWTPGTLEGVGFDALVEQIATAQPVGASSDYELHLFDLPDPALLVETTSGGYAVGLVLVYPDEDDDGSRDADESFLGVAVDMAVLYASAELPAEYSPTGHLLPAGFHPVVLPLACGPLPEISEAGGTSDCGVPLGAACASDDDCGAGVCLTGQDFLPFPWPGGSCALEDSGPGGCRPQPAARLQRRENGGEGSYWLKSCREDAECRVAEDYHCDVGAGACLPRTPLRILLTAEMPDMVLCAPAPGDI